MTENVVQWVMLRKTDFLARHLNLRLGRKLAEYQTTDYGIIDFAFDTADNEVAVVELETEISSTSKLNVCLEQSVRYKQLASQVARPLRVFILYDKLGTPAPFATRLNEESKRHGLELRTYSMLDIKELYQKCMEELERTSGIYLGRPIAMNVTHLRLMNRLLQPFVKAGKSDIPESELTSQFNLQGSRTMYRVRRTMAENFDLLRIVEIKGSKNRAVLTKLGESFCENMVYEPLASGHEFALSHGQRRVLLESLTNGNFTKSKVNLYYLLRFIHITNGEWIPKDRRDIGAGRLTYFVTGHFKTSQPGSNQNRPL
jgi:hypothetical protein